MKSNVFHPPQTPIFSPPSAFSISQPSPIGNLSFSREGGTKTPRVSLPFCSQLQPGVALSWRKGKFASQGPSIPNWGRNSRNAAAQGWFGSPGMRCPGAEHFLRQKLGGKAIFLGGKPIFLGGWLNWGMAELWPSLENKGKNSENFFFFFFL